MMNASEIVFLKLRNEVVFFYFSQFIFGSMQNNGLKQCFKTPLNFAVIRMLIAIAFALIVILAIIFEHVYIFAYITR